MPLKKENHCLAVYDIEHNSTRHKVSEACLDAGLTRIQYSVFWGKIEQAKRKELFHRMKAILGERTGSLLVLPVSEMDFEKRLYVENERDDSQDAEEGKENNLKKMRHKPDIVKPGEKRQTILRFENECD